MLPVGSALTGPIPYGRLARAVITLAPATSCRIAIRRVDYGLAVRGIAGHRLGPPVQRKSVTIDELAVCLFAMQTGPPVELRRGESMWLNDDQWPALFTEGARAGMIVPFTFGATGEGVLLLGDERDASRQPAGLTDRLELLGRRIGQILDLATTARSERRLDRKRQRHRIALARLRERREIAAAERRRLARELHDGVGPGLNHAIMQLRRLRQRGDASADGLRLVEEVAKGALEATRRLAYGIRISASLDDPLGDARLYAGNILSLADCSLHWIDDRSHPDLPLAVAQELGHVIRESVTNAVKYSDANELTVRLTQTDATLSVSISDDGRGFVPMSVNIEPDGRGLGLLGNRERIAELGGTLSIVSVPGGGTIVRTDVPLQPPFQTLKEASRS